MAGWRRGGGGVADQRGSQWGKWAGHGMLPVVIQSYQVEGKVSTEKVTYLVSLSYVRHSNHCIAESVNIRKDNNCHIFKKIVQSVESATAHC